VNASNHINQLISVDEISAEEQVSAPQTVLNEIQNLIYKPTPRSVPKFLDQSPNIPDHLKHQVKSMQMGNDHFVSKLNLDDNSQKENQ
jgi:hypothetical protein